MVIKPVLMDIVVESITLLLLEGMTTATDSKKKTSCSATYHEYNDHPRIRHNWHQKKLPTPAEIYNLLRNEWNTKYCPPWQRPCA